ncbi:MAG: PIN domain-containing protein [Ruminococcus sp.]|jgi:predicted nucleic-acid-binding protein|nr:PIN domain-containing protein [Ruminococcus sp.]MBQ1639253.1 PIN domain-containing protein [Ruminococcus sp.]MBQ2570362.1 PIN domain-containing protein [Ruminococcus sp.]MBQ5381494.1 PIN domain-containing protein [Ruminococcus sp.]MEE1105706.1 PIN domain-containing protein [Ruminococcus sp.]
MILFDANMILRYLLNDDPDMAKKAEQFIIAGDVFVTIEVIAEVVYVLKGVYHLDRQTTADTVLTFLSLVNCQEHDILETALHTYATHNLDFVDCVLFAYHKARNIQIATFDKKLLHLLNQ